MSWSRAPAVDGFYGASSMERLPTELAITGQVREFMGLTLGAGSREPSLDLAAGLSE